MAFIFDLFQRPIYAGIVEGTIRQLPPKMAGIDSSQTRLKVIHGGRGFLARLNTILQVRNPGFTSALAETHFKMTFGRFGRGDRLKGMRKMGFKKVVYTNGSESWSFDV